MENKNRIKTNSPSQKAIVDFGVELRRMLFKIWSYRGEIKCK